MKEVILQKNKSYFLDGKFFIIKSGKVIVRELLETGKVIPTEISFCQGEIIGNFFNFLKIFNFEIPDIEVEAQAIEENTILEELVINEKSLMENAYLKQIVTILLKKALLKLIYQLYDTKGYVLAVLKLYKGDNKFIYKEEIHYANFNISKSQFYLHYRKLKKEKYITEVGEKVYFNIEKVNQYLNLLGEENDLEKSDE